MNQNTSIELRALLCKIEKLERWMWLYRHNRIPIDKTKYALQHFMMLQATKKELENFNHNLNK
ncbi:MAG: hypothetical protein LC109_03365 [Bacteroidia bacterium]|nr:hypothetical protein [Bacteroidia bacterium]